MIFKKLFQKSLVHPWLYHAFNAITAILSAVAWHSIGVYYILINKFDVELPSFTAFVMKNYQNILAFGIVAVGLSIFGFWKKQQEQNIESTIKISLYLMGFTAFCYILCLLAVYWALASTCNMIG